MLSIVFPFLLFHARLLVFAIILYFLAAVLYLVNRMHRIPSLRAVLRVMRVGAKGFSGIARYRFRLAPVRVKEALRRRGNAHVKHPAYPHSTRLTKKKRKR